MNQADGYVQDIFGSGQFTDNVRICAFVVGHEVDPKAAPKKTVGEYATIRATTYGALVDTASRRLFGLKQRLNERYGELQKEAMPPSLRRALRGTVCLSRTASVGFVAIMGRPMTTSQDFANWVCGENLHPDFLMYALLASRSFFRRIAVGATHKTIYMPTLKNFHIYHPSVTVQREVAAKLKQRLAAVSQAEGAARRQLDDLKVLPEKLLVQAFDS